MPQRKKPRRKKQAGGYLRGPSHEKGGIPANLQNGGQVELEGGEYIINAQTVDAVGTQYLDQLNSTATTYHQGGFQPGQLGNNSNYKRGGKIRRKKMARGGRTRRKRQMGGRTSCPPGQHMMPDGTCMQGAYHGAPSNANEGRSTSRRMGAGRASAYKKGGRVGGRVKKLQQGGVMRNRRSVRGRSRRTELNPPMPMPTPGIPTHNHPMGTSSPSSGPAHTHDINPGTGTHSSWNQHSHGATTGPQGNPNVTYHQHPVQGGTHGSEQYGHGTSHLHQFHASPTGEGGSHEHSSGGPNFMSGNHGHPAGSMLRRRGGRVKPSRKMKRGGRAGNRKMRRGGRAGGRRMQAGGYVYSQTGKPYRGQVVMRGAQAYTATASGTYSSTSKLLKKA